MLELSFNLIVGLVVCAVVAVAATAAKIQDQSAPQKEILSNVDERIDVADDNQACGFKNSSLSSFTMTNCTVEFTN